MNPIHKSRLAAPPIGEPESCPQHVATKQKQKKALLVIGSIQANKGRHRGNNDNKINTKVYKSFSRFYAEVR